VIDPSRGVHCEKNRIIAQYWWLKGAGTKKSKTYIEMNSSFMYTQKITCNVYSLLHMQNRHYGDRGLRNNNTIE